MFKVYEEAKTIYKWTKLFKENRKSIQKRDLLDWPAIISSWNNEEMKSTMRKCLQT